MSPFHWSTLGALGGAALVYLLAPVAVRIPAAAMVGAVWFVMMSMGVAEIRMRWFLPAICRGAAGEKRIALTFDDGPDPRATPALLDALHELSVPAAFFCIGKNVEESPRIAARIVEEGHLIANHTQHHSNFTNFLGTGGQWVEMSRAQESILAATKVRPRFYRPPMGLTQPAVARATRRLGLVTIGWTFRAMDRGVESSRVARRVMSNAVDGAIVVLHDGRAEPERLVAIVREIVPALRERGFTFVRLDDMIASELPNE